SGTGAAGGVGTIGVVIFIGSPCGVGARPRSARGNAGRGFGACFGLAVRCGACAGIGSGRRFCGSARFFEGGAGARRVDAGRFDAVIGSTCCGARRTE
ncbi:hypothetical protein QZM96_27690, partial [Burkholderia multivorans]|nr:hypothetical protein [Burkholderia multivorans]